jgi:hypothetical protein
MIGLRPSPLETQAIMLRVGGKSVDMPKVEALKNIRWDALKVYTAGSDFNILRAATDPDAHRGTAGLLYNAIIQRALEQHSTIETIREVVVEIFQQMKIWTGWVLPPGEDTWQRHSWLVIPHGQRKNYSGKGQMIETTDVHATLYAGIEAYPPFASSMLGHYPWVGGYNELMKTIEGSKRDGPMSLLNTIDHMRGQSGDLTCARVVTGGRS